MARLNVYVPDELAARARATGLNVSALTQAAITAELERHALDAWLAGLPLLPIEVLPLRRVMKPFEAWPGYAVAG